MSSLSYLRHRVGRAERRLKSLERREATPLEIRGAGVELMNLLAALAREERRLLDVEAKL